MKTNLTDTLMKDFWSSKTVKAAAAIPLGIIFLVGLALCSVVCCSALMFTPLLSLFVQQ